MRVKIKKVKTSVALDTDLLDWVDEMCKKKLFASTTHAVELGLMHLKDRYEKGSRFG